LVRAYPTIRAAMNKWAEMGEVWQDYDQPGTPTPVQIKTEESWYEPADLWTS
jgi:hypothetical protein